MPLNTVALPPIFKVTFFFNWLCCTKFWLVDWILGSGAICGAVVTVVPTISSNGSSVLLAHCLAVLQGFDSAGLDVGLQWLAVLVNTWPSAKICWHDTLRTLNPPSQVDEHYVCSKQMSHVNWKLSTPIILTSNQLFLKLDWGHLGYPLVLYFVTKILSQSYRNWSGSAVCQIIKEKVTVVPLMNDWLAGQVHDTRSD